MDLFLNGTALEAFKSNGYIVLKPENRTDLIYIINPNTGIVRDINTLTNLYGAYCYYNLQTNLAETLGNSLLTANCSWLTFLSGLVTSMGVGVIKEIYISSKDDIPSDKLFLGLLMTFIGSYGQYYFSECHTDPNPETFTQLCVDYVFSLLGAKLPAEFSGVRVTSGYEDIGLLSGGKSYIIPFNTVEFFEYGNSMGILKIFGQTPGEVVKKIAEEYFNGEIRSLIINKIFWITNEAGKLIPQNTSTYYDNSTEYLTNP